MIDSEEGEVTLVDDPHLPVYSLEEFGECVENGEYVDDDGFGEWAIQRGDKIYTSGVVICPSEFHFGEQPEWATHVVWYNR